jgi:RNA polymerase sigma-70 factor (ECF subfamily)
LIKQHNTHKFNQVVLVHKDAAYNLAKWLTRNNQNAEDLVQESYMKAFQHFDSFIGEDGRAWLLTIVRNTCYTWLKAKQHNHCQEIDADTNFADLQNPESDLYHANPEQIALQQLDRALINSSIQNLPVEFREVIVLREQEYFSYLEIAKITGLPIGTVMSRLARARGLMRQQLSPHFNGGLTQ